MQLLSARGKLNVSSNRTTHQRKASGWALLQLHAARPITRKGDASDPVAALLTPVPVSSLHVLGLGARLLRAAQLQRDPAAWRGWPQPTPAALVFHRQSECHTPAEFAPSSPDRCPRGWKTAISLMRHTLSAGGVPRSKRTAPAAQAPVAINAWRAGRFSRPLTHTRRCSEASILELCHAGDARIETSSLMKRCVHLDAKLHLERQKAPPTGLTLVEV